MMPVMLKNKWHKAIWRVARKWSLSDASAARIPVVVVPDVKVFSYK
jgi:hypothetical protein